MAGGLGDVAAVGFECGFGDVDIRAVLVLVDDERVGAIVEAK